MSLFKDLFKTCHGGELLKSFLIKCAVHQIYSSICLKNHSGNEQKQKTVKIFVAISFFEEFISLCISFYGWRVCFNILTNKEQDFHRTYITKIKQLKENKVNYLACLYYYILLYYLCSSL